MIPLPTTSIRPAPLFPHSTRFRSLALSPVVDIVRAPGWGRIEECWGEDTFLCAEMGVAAVEGLQGPGRLERLAEGKVFATLKHMTGHVQPQGGNNVAPAPIAQPELRSHLFLPFRKVVRASSIDAVRLNYQSARSDGRDKA